MAKRFLGQSAASAGWIGGVAGLAVGLSFGICGQYYVSEKNLKEMTTYAYVRGACGGEIEYCSGTVEVKDAADKTIRAYRISHGAVFPKGVRGVRATKPVLFEDACEMCVFVRDEPAY